MDSANVENLCWIKTSNSFKKVIIRLLKRKGAAKIRSLKKNLKGMDLSFLGIRGKVYINDSLSNYCKLLLEKYKSLQWDQFIHTFWVTQWFHNVHWGINAPQKHHPLFFIKPPPPKSANCPSPPF